jgi:peptidoglycan/xylan/chitin deacetylase (PgdA/CDA1 family)
MAVLPLTSKVTAASLLNPIANPSAETAAGSAPADWINSSWGTNTPTYEYVTNDGHDGTHSLKVSVSGYTDGDAKWYFSPIASLQPGKQYRFNAWYKSNVIPKVVAMFLDANGNESFFGMPAPQPDVNKETVWQPYSDTFSVPLGTQSVSVFMFLDRNGWLQTDDYSIDNYTPSGFNRGLLTMTFDDGHEENTTNALPLLEQYGFKSTQCYATDFIEGQPQPAQQNVLEFLNKGHEICSHTVTHPMLTTVDDATLAYELGHSKQYLESLIGQPVLNFATPYGDYNQHVNSVIDDYYQAHRTVDEGYNSKDNFDQYRLRVQNILSTTTATQVRAWVDQALADKTWLILVYHRIANDPGEFDSNIADFTAHLQTIQQSGITVKTFQDALTETKSQLTTTPPATKPGDVNGDGVVGLADLRTLSKNYGKETGAVRSEGDLNGDGAVSLADLRILSKNWSN